MFIISNLTSCLGGEIMLKVDLNLQPHGWLDIYLIDDAELYIPASYLSDTIEDLIRALSVFMEGELESITKIETEPEEYRFRFYKENNSYLLEVYEFDETFNSDALTDGKLVFTYESDQYTIVRTFYNEINKFKNLGITKYHELWGYEFPQALYERLKNNFQILKDKRS